MTPPHYDLRGVFFHGTRVSGLSTLEPSKTGEFGPGIYLTSFQPTAWFYARSVARGPGDPVVLRVRTRILNPYVIGKAEWVKQTQKRTPRSLQASLVKKGHDGLVGVALNDQEFQLVVFSEENVIVVRELSEPEEDEEP